MSSTVFKIVMHGLIALAPSVNENDLNHITALLVNTEHFHNNQCIGTHEAKLSFLPDDTGRCDEIGCVPEVSDQCVCKGVSLARKRIWLTIDPPVNLVSQEIPSNVDAAFANNHGLPANKIAAGNLLYVANMRHPPFNMELNPDYLAPQPQSQNLLARMEVPFSTLTACSLSKREDQGEAYVQSMSLRKLGVKGKSTDPSQALAQLVLAQFNVEENRNVTLHMSNFDGSNLQSILLARSNNGYVIDLSNEPTEELPYGELCDDGVARHFAVFYTLTQQPPPSADQIIPQARFLHSVKVADVDPDACKDPSFTAVDRPICPMTSFIP